MKPRKSQLGLTLVEITVALALSAVLATALFRMFSGNQQGLILTDTFSRTQVSARTTFDLLQYDLRMAQYLGCINSKSAINSVIGVSGGSEEFYYGFNKKRSIATLDSFLDADTNSTILVLRKAIGIDAQIRESFPVNAPFNAIGPHNALSGLKSGDVLMLTDCQQADLFKIQTVDTGQNPILIKPEGNLTRPYPAGSHLLLMHTVVYYVKPSELIDVDGVNSLYVYDSLDGAERELVPYVDKMSLSFLVEDPNTEQRRYITSIVDDNLADENIYAVRLSLELETEKSCKNSNALNCLQTQKYERNIFVRNRRMAGE